MATLKELLAGISTNSTIEFRNNDKASVDGTLWANGWVKNMEGKLLCVGATLETLEKLETNPDIDNLMLTKPEARLNSSNGLEYDMCQLFIDNTFKISLQESNTSFEMKSNNIKKSNFIIHDLNQKLLKSIFIGFLIAIIFGFLFFTEIFLYKGYEVSSDDNYTFVKEAFNYKLATLTFALVSGFMFFVFYDGERKTNLKTKINFLFDKCKSNKILKFFTLKEIKKNVFFSFYNLLFNFNGRISRRDFLGETLALNLISFPFWKSLQSESCLVFKIIFMIIYLFFSVKTNVRRLHDFNFSGWYSIIFLIPFGTYLSGLLTKWDFLMTIILRGWNVLFGVIIIYNLILLIMPGNQFTNTFGKKNKCQ